MTNNRALGNSGELMAIEYLQKKGIKIIDTNYTIKGGEIDIIGKSDDITVFVEVKLRNSLKFGIPEEALTKTKKRHLLKTIQFYSIVKKISPTKIRADFISITNINGDYDIKHYENIGLY